MSQVWKEGLRVVAVSEELRAFVKVGGVGHIRSGEWFGEETNGVAEADGEPILNIKWRDEPHAALWCYAKHVIPAPEN